MTERVDHAAEARAWLEGSETPQLSIPETTAFAAIAQVHATLALVEQQRVANRIALAATVAAASRHAGMHGSVLGLIVDGVGIFDNPPTEHGVAPLHEDVREALGL